MSPCVIQEISASSITMSPTNSARRAGSRSRAATSALTTSSGAESYTSLHAPTTIARTRSVSTAAVKRPKAASHCSSES